MLSFFFLSKGVGGNGSKVYRCVACGSVVTHSDRIILVAGNTQHQHVNPEGIECDFYTFSSCPGAIALGEATEAHTWFPGYSWRVALCVNCGLHLGWHYELLSKTQPPMEFWGILIAHVAVSEEAGPEGEE